MQVRPLRRWRTPLCSDGTLKLVSQLVRRDRTRPRYGDRAYLTDDESVVIQYEHDGWYISRVMVMGDMHDKLHSAGIYSATFKTRSAAVEALESVMEDA